MNRFFQLHHSTKSDQLCKLLVFYIFLNDTMIYAFLEIQEKEEQIPDWKASKSYEINQSQWSEESWGWIFF